MSGRVPLGADVDETPLEAAEASKNGNGVDNHCEWKPRRGLRFFVVQ